MVFVYAFTTHAIALCVHLLYFTTYEYFSRIDEEKQQVDGYQHCNDFMKALYFNGKTVPCHYLYRCWNIVNSNLRNKLQWNRKRNLYIFIQENAFENVVWKMAAILSRHQCVDVTILGSKSGDVDALAYSGVKCWYSVSLCQRGIGRNDIFCIFNKLLFLGGKF